MGQACGPEASTVRICHPKAGGNSKTQNESTLVKYNLENLNWREFERLCTHYFKDKIGEGVWASDGTKDQGRDAEFHGTANEFPSSKAPWAGNWIFQVKHRTTQNQSSLQVERRLLKDLRTEINKIFIKHQFPCHNFVFVTNLNVSNSFRSRAAEVFVESMSDRHPANFAVIDYKDLEAFIDNNTYIKRAFPPLLSFTDLENVFLKKEETKNKGYIRSAYKGIQKFVSTLHYSKCVDVLSQFPFLMLVGDTKSGKTTLVEALAVAFLEQGGFKPYFIRNPDEFFTIASYLSSDETALFICDDIFGQHELETAKLADWTDYFGSVMGAVHENHRFVFTTRKYIFEQFANRSGLRSLFPGESDPNRYIIKLNSLHRDEREPILEKHLEHSGLPPHIVRKTLRAKDEILGCEDFSPEVIRSLVALIKETAEEDLAAVISKHIRDPNQYLLDFFNRISPDKKLLLVSLAVAPNKDSRKVESRFLGLLSDCGMTPTRLFTTFIDELDGSIVRRREYPQSHDVEYYHPSMYDVMVGIFANDQHYRSLMLRNVNLDLLWLLTLTASPKRQRAIQMSAWDFREFERGIEQFLLNDAALRDAAVVLQWIAGSLNVELSSNLTFRHSVLDVKNVVRTSLLTNDFFKSNVAESLEQWVNLFDKWNAVPGAIELPYREDLARLHWHSSRARYFRLVFAMESVSPGIVQKHFQSSRFNLFVSRLRERVHGLRIGLNITSEGKLKTYEDWLITFYLVNDLITKMKKSAAGREIISGQLLDDWEKIKRHSDTAKYRHLGMLKVGQWKSTPSIRGIGSEKLWESLL